MSNVILWLQIQSLKKKFDTSKPKNLHVKLALVPDVELKNYEIKLEISRNKVDISTLKEDVDLLKEQMTKAFAYFGSIIRHSEEQPYKKEAIAKFLSEHGTKEGSSLLGMLN